VSTPTLTAAPPVDSLGRVTTGEAAALTALAAAHSAERSELSKATQDAIAGIWRALNRNDLGGGWAAQRVRAATYLEVAQRRAASGSAAYVQRALAVQGVAVDRPQLDPAAFGGLTSDGRGLDGLLVGGVVATKRAIASGRSPEQAALIGERYLRIAVQGEIADAQTNADQVALVAASAGGSTAGQLQTVGWVRMLNPPSCGRCAVLAGRFYRWNSGFERHEMCNCVHTPALEALDDDLTVDPDKYFASLTPEQQKKYFGKANAEAIDAGSNIAKVMNASTRRGALYTVGDRRYTMEGTTRRGYYSKVSTAGRAKERRPTPYQIMKDAAGSKGEALRLLYRYGYVV
jgi:hypothetical protein